MSMKKHLWIETTTSKYDHGGQGWEHGRCLWAPGPGTYGSKRYEFMKELLVGEPVIHAYDRVYCGISWVAEKCSPVYQSPPNAGPWAIRAEYCRINLCGYREFEKQLAVKEFIEQYSQEILDDIRDDIRASKPRRYPFCFHAGTVKPTQGQFLTKATERLEKLLLEALHLDESEVWKEAGRENP